MSSPTTKVGIKNPRPMPKRLIATKMAVAKALCIGEIVHFLEKTKMLQVSQVSWPEMVGLIQEKLCQEWRN